MRLRGRTYALLVVGDKGASAPGVLNVLHVITTRVPPKLAARTVRSGRGAREDVDGVGGDVRGGDCHLGAERLAQAGTRGGALRTQADPQRLANVLKATGHFRRMSMRPSGASRKSTGRRGITKFRIGLRT